MELKIEKDERFGTVRTTKDNGNPKLEGDLLYCVDDICEKLGVDLEWACDTMGRGFVFPYTFDGATLKFTIKYAVDKLFDTLCAMSLNGKSEIPIDYVKEYAVWLFRIDEHDLVMSVTPEHEVFLTENDLMTVYEIKVNVCDIHGCIIKTTTLDTFSDKETAHTFLREYSKRVTGWVLEQNKFDDGVELHRYNPDGTATRMLVKPKAVFKSWDAYVNKYSEMIRVCDLKF